MSFDAKIHRKLGAKTSDGIARKFGINTNLFGYIRDNEPELYRIIMIGLACRERGITANDIINADIKRGNK